MNNVAYETDATEGSNGRCPIPLQRETPTGLVDGICGSEAPPKHAGLCKYLLTYFFIAFVADFYLVEYLVII